ncbi:type II toxin-antitoxin system RelE family toxin [Leucobacter sp. BZR 635]
MADDPLPHGATKLVGEATAWRIRVGDSRVVCGIFDESLVVSEVRAGHRREVHRLQCLAALQLTHR